MKTRLILSLFLALASSALAQTSSYYVPPGVTNIRAMLTGSAFNPGTPPQYMQDYCVAQRVGLAQLSGDLPAMDIPTGSERPTEAKSALTEPA